MDFLNREPVPVDLPGGRRSKGARGRYTCDRLHVSRVLPLTGVLERGYFTIGLPVSLPQAFTRSSRRIAKVRAVSQTRIGSSASCVVNEFVTRRNLRRSTADSITSMVDTRLSTAGLRTNAMPGSPRTAATKTREQVCGNRRENSVYKSSQEAFVVMQYFGYLVASRTPSFWWRIN